MLFGGLSHMSSMNHVPAAKRILLPSVVSPRTLWTTTTPPYPLIKTTYHLPESQLNHPVPVIISRNGVCSKSWIHSVLLPLAWTIFQPGFCAFFYKPLTRLFNLSIATSTVPQQWKSASIHPLPKVTAPIGHSDFRPISITPVLSRIMKRTVVRHFLYPALFNPPPTPVSYTHLTLPTIYSV